MSIKMYRLEWHTDV